MTSDGLTPAIRVVYFASSRQPGIVADEDMWAYGPESFEKIGQWTGTPAARVKEMLDAGEEITTAMWSFRVVYPITIETVEPHTPCTCAACAFAMANDLLSAAEWDCHDYPRSGSEGACSDPHSIGCSCDGTAVFGGACEACQLVSEAGGDWASGGRAASADLEPGQVIHVWFTEGSASPESIEGEETWPYTVASLKRIQRITGLTLEQTRSNLDAGALVTTSLLWLRLVPVDEAWAAAILAGPTPRVVAASDGPGPVTTAEPCDCPVCSFVASRGYLEEGHIDCNDHPRFEGRGPCGDPHTIGCRCPGTLAEGGPCEACDAYPVGHQAIPILVEGRRRDR